MTMAGVLAVLSPTNAAYGTRQAIQVCGDP